MTSTNPSLLLAGGLGLLIGIGGGAAGALLVDRGQRTVPASSETGSAEQEMISSAIERLAVEMQNLRASTEARSSQPSTAGEMRVPATDPATERLERAVTKLTEVLESPRANVARSIPASAVEHQRIGGKQVALLEELRAMKPDERLQPYLFWSLQDVLDRFGEPDSFTPQPEQMWLLYYDLGDGHAVNFRFTGGMVFEILAG